MDAFFLINNKEFQPFIENPEENLDEVYRKLCELPMTRSCLYRGLLIERDDETEPSADVVMACLKDRLKACTTIEDLMDLAISVSSAIGVIPMDIDAFNHWNNWFFATMDNPDFKNEIKEFLFIAYLYNKRKMEPKNKNGDLELSYGRFFSRDKDNSERGKKTQENIDRGRHRLSVNRFNSHAGNLVCSDDYIYSLILNKRFPRNELKTNYKNKQKDASDPLLERKPQLKVASVFDAVLTVGLSGAKHKNNPYIGMLKDYMERNDLPIDSSKVTIEKFLHLFLPDFLEPDSFNSLEWASLKYILERLTNANLISSVCQFDSNSMNTVFKNSMAEACKFLAMHPLPHYRIHLVEEVEKLAYEQEKIYRDECLDAVFQNCPKVLLDLLDKNLLKVIIRANKPCFLKIIKIFFRSISEKEQEELLKNFANNITPGEETKPDASQINKLKEAYIKICKCKKQNMKGLDVIKDLRQSFFQEKYKLLRFLSRRYMDDMLNILSDEQIRKILLYFNSERLQLLLKATYKDEFENDTEHTPFVDLQKIFQNMPSDELKNMIRLLPRDHIPPLPEHDFPVLDFLAIVTYQSFVFFPVLNLIFQIYVAIKSKEGNDFSFEYETQHGVLHGLFDLESRETSA